MTFITRKIIITSATILYALPFCASAQESPSPHGPLLNKVSYQTSVEKWSTTTTANLTVNIDASLDKIGLADMNNHVLQNLNKIAPSNDWHITQFSRLQDKSGLETLHIEAEARLPATALTAIRDKAKAITKPGETYTVADIDFSPSMAELAKTHADARAAIYYDVKQEIGRLNQAYPDQHYFLDAIDFGTFTPGPQPVMAARIVQPQAMFASVGPASVPGSAAATAMPVNTKIVESATVVIASTVPGYPIAPAAPAPTPALAPAAKIPTPAPAPAPAKAPAPTSVVDPDKVSINLLPFSAPAAPVPKK